MLFYVFGRNLNKYHKFKQKTLVKFEGKAAEEFIAYNAEKVFWLCKKNHD